MSGVFCVLNNNATKSCSFRCVYILWKLHRNVRLKMNLSYFGDRGIWTAHRGDDSFTFFVAFQFLFDCALQVIHIPIFGHACTVAFLNGSFINFVYCSFLGGYIFYFCTIVL